MCFLVVYLFDTYSISYCLSETCPEITFNGVVFACIGYCSTQNVAIYVFSSCQCVSH